MITKTPRLTTREKKIEDWFELPMIIVTLLLVVTLAVPIIFSLPSSWVGIFAFVNLLIWFSFYIELFVKIYVSKNKLKALKRNWALVIITIAPLFLPLRLIRVSRLVGLVRFLRLQKWVQHMRKSIREIVYNVEYILITFVIFIFSSAFVMWQIESRFDGTINSLPDALWWSVITITTIGYGDVVPASPEGRVVGAIVSLLGTILFMVFLARVTAVFVHDKNVEVMKKILKKK